MDSIPMRFIGEEIEVVFDKPPVLEKKPSCPSGFRWGDEEYLIIRLLAEWQDFKRRGRMARNMRPEHASHAALKGSWGVGRFYFRVEVTDGRIFELYYDRSPENASDRKGHWYLLGERRIVSEDH